jgi:hypothetical protein
MRLTSPQTPFPFGVLALRLKYQIERGFLAGCECRFRFKYKIHLHKILKFILTFKSSLSIADLKRSARDQDGEGLGEGFKLKKTA